MCAFAFCVLIINDNCFACFGACWKNGKSHVKPMHTIIIYRRSNLSRDERRAFRFFNACASSIHLSLFFLPRFFFGQQFWLWIEKWHSIAWPFIHLFRARTSIYIIHIRIELNAIKTTTMWQQIGRERERVQQKIANNFSNEWFVYTLQLNEYIDGDSTPFVDIFL